MGDSPRVSVIVATYNWSSVLRYAIESVLWQTLSDFELLVIGDGCTDDSAEVVASFRDPRVTWQNLPENSGHQSAPNNAGLARARGKFIAYLGHDDLWHPTHLEGLVRAMEESVADVGYSWMEMIWPRATGMRVITGLSPNGETEPSLVLPPSSIMHRRDLIEAIGNWKDYRSISAAPDAEFIARAHESGKKFVQVKQLTVFKFNAAGRPDCYREKPSHEQAEYVVRMKNEPDFLLRELCAYVDLHARRNPDDITWAGAMSGLEPGAHITNARVIRGLEEVQIPPPHFPPLPRARIHFDSEMSEPFLWHGWSHREDSYRWTDGKKAALAFRVRPNVALQFTIEAEPFLSPGKIDAQRIAVHLNGALITELRLVSAEAAVLNFEFPARLLRAENVIEFVLPDAISPVALGINTDVRRLALRVAWLEFRALESA